VSQAAQECGARPQTSRSSQAAQGQSQRREERGQEGPTIGAILAHLIPATQSPMAGAKLSWGITNPIVPFPLSSGPTFRELFIFLLGSRPIASGSRDSPKSSLRVSSVACSTPFKVDECPSAAPKANHNGGFMRCFMY
jgi:hypothetical protein